MRYQILCIAAGFALCLTAGSTAFAEPNDTAYTIKLERPAQVGDTAEYRTHATSNRTTVTAQKGKEPSTDADYQEVTCLVRENILKVSEDGKVVQERVVLETFQGRNAESAEMKPLDLAGVTIEATLAPAVSFKRTDGKPISDEDISYLKMVFDGSDTGSKKDDNQLFAPHGPVKVGDKWEADHEAISSGLSKASSIILPASGITAPFTLTSLEKIDADTYLKVDGYVNADPITIPLPEGTKGTPFTGTMKSSLSKTIGADPKKGMHATTMDMEMTVKGAVQPSSDSDPIEMTMTMKEHKDVTVLSGVK